MVSGFRPPCTQTSQVYNLASPLTDGETWGALLNLGLLQFPRRQMGLIINPLVKDYMWSQGINTGAFSATVPGAVSTLLAVVTPVCSSQRVSALLSAVAERLSGRRCLRCFIMGELP